MCYFVVYSLWGNPKILRGGEKMKKAIALLLAVLSVFSILGSTVFGVVAAGVEPRWNNTNSATVGLVINESGYASVDLSCIGMGGVTTKITAETKLERKWGLLWLDVDGAEWTDTSSTYYLSKSHYAQLSKKATYRATTEYTVTGTGGANDAITCRCEYTYD